MHDNVVDLEDHLHDLRRQEQLLLFANERLEDQLRACVCVCACVCA